MSDMDFKKFINIGYRSSEELAEQIRRLVAEKLRNEYGDEPTEFELEGTNKPVSQPIPKESAEINPKKARFLEMRKIAASHESGFGSVERIFLAQARFMEDFTDDFSTQAFYNDYRPCFENMSFAQLRTYFTWRTNVRKGDYIDVDVAYVRLYAYELLNGIGVAFPMESVNKLLELWKNCRKFDKGLDHYIPLWLKDFLAFNNIDCDFSALAVDFPVKGKTLSTNTVKILQGDYSKMLKHISYESSYKIFDSIFLIKFPKNKLEEALENALKTAETYLAERKIKLSELLEGRLREEKIWSPFRGAIYCKTAEYPDAEYYINAGERYSCKNGIWRYYRLSGFIYREFNAFLLRVVESELRLLTGFSYRLKANTKAVYREFSTRKKVRDVVCTPEFEQVLRLSVDEYYSKAGLEPFMFNSKKAEEYTEPVVEQKPVEIDLTRLDGIRKSADELAKRLIIDEEAEDFDDEITVDNENNVNTTESAVTDFESGDEWQALSNALSDAEKSVVQALLSGGDIRKICDKNGILPEVMLEAINEKALEIVGDNIIECGEEAPYIYDEYVQELEL